MKIDADFSSQMIRYRRMRGASPYVLSNIKREKNSCEAKPAEVEVQVPIMHM